jgi:hypothetical protein
MMTNTSVMVPIMPLRFLGASSPRYMGRALYEMPGSGQVQIRASHEQSPASHAVEA